MSEGPPTRLTPYQAALLARLFLHPAQPFAVEELAVDVGLPTRDVDPEMQPLVAAGLVIRHLHRSTDVYRADTAHGYARTLTEFLAATFGPVPVVGEEFATLHDARLILIFGGWADVHAAPEAALARDVDVLVVGSPDGMAVAEAAERAEQRLDLPVNPVVRTSEQWELAVDPLVARMQRDGYVTVLAAH
jgi:hypothetical protein